MGAYENFAAVYDMFMDNVDYDGWCAFLTEILRERGIRDGLVCELGCGTGSMTERLAGAGYDMIGIDSSVDMLDMAEEKKLQSGHDILYLNQDMRDFELYGTVRAVVSVCDSMNYILTEEDMLKVFRLVNNYLDPGGLFIFDMNTAAEYEGIGNATIAENREEGSFIWDNVYDHETRLNEYMLTLFVPEESSAVRQGGLFRRYEETHLQRAYPADRIKTLLEKAGLIFECAYAGYSRKEPGPDTKRILFAARENGKRWEQKTESSI